MAKPSCTPEVSRRALMASAVGLPVAAVSRPAVPSPRTSATGAEVEAARDRLILQAEHEQDEDESHRLRMLAWDHHVDALEQPCNDLAGAARKLRALLHPDMGAEAVGDFQASDATCVRQVLAWLEGA